MKLSVIIVNHNRCDLLKLALNALIKAGNSIDYELIMIDNASTDNSVEMVNADYPDVRIIANLANEGVAKAGNQGIEVSRGEYILLVNADTICGKETLDKVLDFMNVHNEAAGVGVRMLGAQGSFLPESNRGLTQPWVTFFKLIGFAKNFQKTRLSNRNHKAWVEEFQTSEVDVLNDAFMLIRKSVLNEVGLFDERFVQYGHNIDLSYRMRLAGYKNYYFPKTYIINFKSNDQSKFSWQYIKNFYGAMLIFAAKYLFRLPEIKIEGMQMYPAAYEVEQ
ncbi:glycosyltransferase family 2 protein [Mucilaginibacter sp. UR6-11]|uniref:glycosyltransferase family 2 protein n=1 Tax=Mucilaginibacter sp. UR6-11 TaxID=1435644 RepID=UPI0021042084|nr:glycosyltransferase family 2 protein [Mucilaginibacter sp. UR6-11]MCC8425968.1 glycosyltransferase family 2 protein [Mucilaginibacter sp. UR6-11]